MKIKFNKTHKDAYVPTKSYKGSSGYDVKAISKVFIHPNQLTTVNLHLRMEIPLGYEAQVRPRSSSIKRGVLVIFGTIDSDYRGEVKVQLFNMTNQTIVINGDAIAQLVFQKVEELGFEYADVLSETNRGKKGFGSSDVK